jgi:hypothetical protein
MKKKILPSFNHKSDKYFNEKTHFNFNHNKPNDGLQHNKSHRKNESL